MHRALVSLSMITALWEKRRTDYLDNFVPFLATLANRRQIKRVDITKVNSLCSQFADEFGLRIPYHPMIAILNRCRRRGVLRKTGAEFIFHRSRSAELDFSSEEALFVSKIKTVVEQLASYANSCFKVTLDETIAEELILDLLKRSDMDILFASGETTSALPDLSLSKKHKRYHHILYRFVIYIHESNPGFYRELADIAIGHVITNAILVYDHDWPGETVKNCSFYIDTPILLKLLGADGPEQQAAYSDFFSRLRKNGARFFVFDHLYVELNQILENSKVWVNNPAFDPAKASRVALFFRQAGYTDLDIEKFILRVDTVFTKFNIERVGVPPYMEFREHQIDEVVLLEHLESVLKERDPLFDKDVYADRTKRD
ncbi:unnamed protein product, partial [marine sediment metagenome]